MCFAGQVGAVPFGHGKSAILRISLSRVLLSAGIIEIPPLPHPPRPLRRAASPDRVEDILISYS